MALANIVKINLIAHAKHQKEIWERIQDLGYVEVERAQEIEEKDKNLLGNEISKLEYQLAGVKFSLDFLAGYGPKKTISETLNPTVIISKDEIKKIVSTFKYKDVVEKTQKLESTINEIRNRLLKYQQEIAILEPWQKLAFIPNKKNIPEDFGIFYFISSTVVHNNFTDRIKKEFPNVAIYEAEKNSKEVYFALIFLKRDEQKILEAASALQIKNLDIPSISTLPRDHIDNLKGRILECEKELFKQDAGELLESVKDLKVVYDFLSWEKDRLENQLRAKETKRTFSIEAWIDEGLINNLKEEVGKITESFILEKVALKNGEQSPVKFKNTWAKPFEFVTNIYGMPQASELDPTPFLAPFFALFFGLALTDAGYGILLALGSLIAVRVLKIPKENQKLFKVLFWGGVASFVVGIFTGGWFSADIAKLPSIIAAPLGALQLINPLENALTIFYISLGLGVLQVLFGLGLDAWWKIKSGKTYEGLTGSGLWIIIILSLLGFAGASMGLAAASLAGIFKIILIISALGLVVAKAFQQKNFLLGLPTGLLGLYGIVGYFSDVLSYSRLLALGLTTGIIGMVVNLIAGLVSGIPWIGWLAALVILIGGHVFNLGINALGAFIHSGRLQYIEFFPKFMEGGGRPFQPMFKESKYIRVQG